MEASALFPSPTAQVQHRTPRHNRVKRDSRVQIIKAKRIWVPNDIRAYHQLRRRRRGRAPPGVTEGNPTFHPFMQSTASQQRSILTNWNGQRVAVAITCDLVLVRSCNWADQRALLS